MRWLTRRRRRRTPAARPDVTVVFELDSTGFTEGMAACMEVIRHATYVAHLRDQRHEALQFLDDLLDDWCRDLGLDPQEARAPYCEQQLGAFSLEPWQTAWLNRLRQKGD
jgi:hypothetical protein